ncbi:MAG: sigma-54-dependent Fis family transcriptional regulator [Deltaproteobacteria bacterium]|nr:sigma-54-dependent Fis family transcriptional regulator [Deltaproteobacteria bacterium]MBK8715060.1 sigma-54-dependent Fis family transcriptional regulator [Deltaproteobacteria bacterium]MBP7287076.1 sigma-54-dependent Fis family transcriptional regulator [Nannocystaceae bacterium]
MLMLAPGATPRWERFQERRYSEDEISADPLLSRWARVARAGVRADADPHPIAPANAPAPPELDAALELDSPFGAFGAAMAAAGFSALLCDAIGVIRRQHTGGALQPKLSATRLVEGAWWGEQARGTNAIGTAIVERAPVAVLGAAHFERSNHGLCCYAAPLHDPRGDLVGVLDATGPAEMAHPALEAAVLGATAAVEAWLAAHSYRALTPGGLDALRRRLAATDGTAFVLERSGRVRLCNADGRRLLGEGDRLGDDFARRLGLPLLAAGTRVVGGMRVEVEPIGEHDTPWSAVVRISRARTPTRRKPPEVAIDDPFRDIVGSDPAITHARERARRFAPSQLPVLLLAETGTGKELFARAIHGASDRRRGPFVAVNCGALTGSLLESELFGYAAGAFTGARASGHDGKLAAADGGTLFLDELAEMSAGAQALLLRFLEDGSYYRVGDHHERRADVRVVGATCRDLTAAVLSGSFRSDLYYRIHGVAIRLAPLRERRDLDELIDALLGRIAVRYGAAGQPRISAAARRALSQHGWPGNVRELRTALEHAWVLAGEHECIEPEHLPLEPTRAPGNDTREAAERAATAGALIAAGGNLSEAARRLGVSRSTLYRLLDRHGLRSD